jgi:protein involved in polysaccharide export with SLBB domain
MIEFLEQQPDAMVEVKALVADLAQQQGVSIQPDAITDEMLDSRIASSADLRAIITNFLRARGYISEADVQESSAEDERANSIPGAADPAGLAGESLNFENQAGERLGQAGNGMAQADRSAYPAGAVRGNGTFAAQRDRTGNQAPGSTSEPQVLHLPTPANLLSLRDLYTQLPDQSGPLKRFGSDVFLRRGSSMPSRPESGQTGPTGTGLARMSQAGMGQVSAEAQEIPQEVPAGPDYVVGPGDSLAIDIWGGVSQSLSRVIDREGRVSLPESGVVQVAGLTLGQAQSVIADTLKHQFRDVQVAVTIGRLRSIRVYVVGDVQRPGAYDISSLATSLNALYAAGGPTSTGSLRVLRHLRGSQLIGEIDLYDFLLHGVRAEDRLQAGDTVLVPPAGPQIAVFGAVKRPAIYELKEKDLQEKATLAAVLEEAGGITVAAELGHIEIDRIDANRQRETVTLELKANGDAQSAKAAMADFAVQDGDRIRISPILPYSQRVIYVQGHVVRPGRQAFHDGMRIADVLKSYRDLLPEPADKAEIVRLVGPDLHPETIEFNLPEALIGNENLALQPFDTIRVNGRYEADAPKVTIGGEVLRPGVYALHDGMTAAQLVRMAGGFKRDALLDNADLTSYSIRDMAKVESERTSIRIGDAVQHPQSKADAILKPGDVLTVHQITGWNDIGSSITIQGEVDHPGNYGIQQGERLSSILRRAGGFRDTSYPAGAVLIREEVRRLEEKSRQELIRQIETSATAARINPGLGNNDPSATLQMIGQQQDQVVNRLRSQPAVGRLVIRISGDITSWENTPDDIEVRAGDVLRIPKRPGFVLVSGQVYNSTAITYSPDQTAAWYLRRAGGVTEIANKSEIFIIRANGSVVGRGTGTWLDHDVLSTKLDPGDVVVVPQKIIGASVFWRNLLTVAQISSSIAITAALAGVL